MSNIKHWCSHCSDISLMHTYWRHTQLCNLCFLCSWRATLSIKVKTVWRVTFFLQTNGFYVECGAFDGEQMSNTIFLELQRQWTGLLVEMDPYFYSQLLAKNRKSWSINACLSPKPYVTQVNLHVNSCSVISDKCRFTEYLITCMPVNSCIKLEVVVSILRITYVYSGLSYLLFRWYFATAYRLD